MKESTAGKLDRIKQLEKQLEELRCEHEAELSSVRGELKKERDHMVSEAQQLITKAENLTNQIGDGFGWDLAYGMGGYYDGSDERWCSSSENC